MQIRIFGAGTCSEKDTALTASPIRPTSLEAARRASSTFVEQSAPSSTNRSRQGGLNL